MTAGYTSAPHALHVPHILYSTDDGARWLPGRVPSGVGQITALTCSSPALCVAVGIAATGTASRAGLVLESPDGGRTWSRAVVPPDAPSFTDVVCPTPQRCLATASPVLQRLGLTPNPLPTSTPRGPALYISTDAGRRWNDVAITPGVEALNEISCGSSTTCMAVGPGAAATPRQPSTEPWIVVSQDGGSTWSEATPPVVALPSDAAVDTGLLPRSITCVLVHCVLAGVVEGTTSVAVFSTADAGATWVSAAGVVEDGASSFQMLPGLVRCSGTGTCLGFTIDSGTGEMGAELTSGDGGITWQRVGPLPTNANSATVPGGPVDDLWCTAASCLAVGGWTGYLSAARSNDAGATWSSVTLPVALSALSSASCWSARSCMAVGSTATGTALALVTSDAGRTWLASPVPAGVPPLAVVSCPARAWCTALATQQDGPLNAKSYLLRTFDAGESWNTTALPGSVDYASLSCWTKTACIAVGSASPLTDVGASALITPGAITPITLPARSAALAGVSCPNAQSCVAVSTSLLVNGLDVGASTFRLSGSVGHYAWGHLGHISSAFVVGPPDNAAPQRLHCVSTDVCYLATQHLSAPTSPGTSRHSGKSVILVSNDAGRTWHVTARAPAGGSGFNAVACASATRCIAVGQGRSSTGAAVLRTHDARHSWHDVAPPAGVGDLTSATCADAHHCLAVGALLTSAGLLISGDGGNSWTVSSLPVWTETSDGSVGR